VTSRTARSRSSSPTSRARRRRSERATRARALGRCERPEAFVYELVLLAEISVGARLTKSRRVRGAGAAELFGCSSRNGSSPYADEEFELGLTVGRELSLDAIAIALDNDAI